MVMLSTRHTATTWVLSMLADTAVAGGYVAATVELRVRLACCTSELQSASAERTLASQEDRRGVDILLSCFAQSGRHFDRRVCVHVVASRDLQM